MPDIEYRVFINNKPSTREQLDSIENITVNQGINMAWEASVQIPIGTDDKGNWSCTDKVLLEPFTRFRIEIKNGALPFIPLIDGPVVWPDISMNSEPGQSSITLVIQDDSVFLNKDDRIIPFENKSDNEIASEIFKNVKQIDLTVVKKTKSKRNVVQRETDMQLLRKLAKPHDFHAYVLPGKEPGKSVGYFMPFTTKTDGLPTLVLLGPDRNMENFTLSIDAQRPSKFYTSGVSIDDKVCKTLFHSQLTKSDLIGEEAAFERLSQQILPPHGGETVDLDDMVSAKSLNSSFSIEATGATIPSCYEGVLQPYKLVNVKASNTQYSGVYRINKVTHTLTRSSYSQSFTLSSNSISNLFREGNSSQGGIIS